MENKYSINEISEQAGVHWKTASEYLRLLVYLQRFAPKIRFDKENNRIHISNHSAYFNELNLSQRILIVLYESGAFNESRAIFIKEYFPNEDIQNEIEILLAKETIKNEPESEKFFITKSGKIMIFEIYSTLTEDNFKEGYTDNINLLEHLRQQNDNILKNQIELNKTFGLIGDQNPAFFPSDEVLQNKIIDEMHKVGEDLKPAKLGKVKETMAEIKENKVLVDDIMSLIYEAERSVKNYEFGIKTDVLLYESPYEEAIANYQEAKKLFQKIGWDEEASRLVSTIKFYKEKNEKDKNLRKIEKKKLEDAEMDRIKARITSRREERRKKVVDLISTEVKIPNVLFSSDKAKNKVKCQFCGYNIIKPFPKDFMCPKCSKFLPDLTLGKMEKVQPKQFATKTNTLSSKLKGKVRVKKKPIEITMERDRIKLTKGEYIKLLGITSTDRTQLFCSNDNLRYLLELTNNLDLIATGVLGGELDKMHLISEEDNTEEKCQFYVKNEIIYLVYGSFPDKKGKWLLEQMSNNYAELTRDKDVNNLSKFEMYQTELEFKKRAKFILSEYLKLQKTFSDQEIPYVEDTIRIDYLGLSSMSIGVVSLLLGDELVTELRMEFESPEEEREMKESMITARIEAIAANTQGNTGMVPRWIAVKLGFQKYRFISFKKYQNNYFLSLLSEGNLGKIEQVEQLLETKIIGTIVTPFSGNLKPFNKLRVELETKFIKRRIFPPFDFS